MRSRPEHTKREWFDFEKMKAAATHADPVIRKEIFVEYFDRFEEFPSYLFDNEFGIDGRLFETVDDLRKDPASSKAMLDGIDALLARLKR